MTAEINPYRSPLDAAERPTWARYRVMLFLGGLSFLTYYDRVCIVRAQQDIQRDLSLDDAAMGWIMTAFWAAYALFDIPCGWLGDRYGARFTLTRIVLAWSVFTALSGAAAGFWSLLAFRFLFGVGEAGAYPNMARVQSQWLPIRSRAFFGGLLWLMARWGGAFSPVLFGLLLKAFDSAWLRDWIAAMLGDGAAGLSAWRFGFFASGLIGVVWCVAFYPWFRDRPADHPRVNAAELALIEAGRGADAPTHAHAAGMWRELFTCPSLWAMALLYLCGSFGWSFFVSWMPRFLKDVHGVEFAKSEWTSGLPLFVGGVACLAGGAASDWLVRVTGWRRLGRAVFPICGCLTAAGAMCGLQFVQTADQAVVLMCLAAGAYDFGQGANWSSIVDLGGRYAGSATGFINTIGNLGNILQPVVGAVIFSRLGWNTLLTVYAATYIAAASMWLFIDPRRSFHDRGP